MTTSDRPRSRRSIYLAEDQWEALRELALREDRSVNSLVRRAIAAMLAIPETFPQDTQPGPGDARREKPAPTPAVGVAGVTPSDPNRLIAQGIGETDDVPPNQDDYRPPTDDEAKLLREAYPHLKNPKVKR